MPLAVSTHWNTYRHGTGEAIIEEILDLGLRHVELGYDLRLDLVSGVKRMVEARSVEVVSVHNFCPIPVGAPYGHPELFLLSSLDQRTRDSAVSHTVRTIEFAREMGARVVVTHPGRIDMKHLTPQLIRMSAAGRQYEPRYEKLKLKLLMRREKKVGRHLDQLTRSLEALLPTLEQTGIVLALENLPSWEAIPCETEMLKLLEQFNSPNLRYWHDMGHGQVRENLGFIGHRNWVEKLSPYLAGMHVHDVYPPAADHLMPPHGTIDFRAFRAAATSGILLVLEPSPDTPEAAVREGIQAISDAWGL